MKISILTLFPEFFINLYQWSIIGRAVENEIIQIESINIRDFSKNKHKKVDDYPFGGGQGMVMTPEPIFEAINSVRDKNSKVIYLSPQGKKLNQEIVNELSKEEHLILLCGHYEGIDYRIIENYIDEEISIGDYVLTGGEIPAMVLIDAVSRILPGVLSGEDSFTDESHYKCWLEYPQYTRPREFKGHMVPEVLLQGNHKKINEWRKYRSIKATLDKRPDIIDDIKLTKEEKEILRMIDAEGNNN